MPDEEEPPWGRCVHCGGTIYYYQYTPSSGEWIHCFKKADGHEAELAS